jgi:hypothetical protein
MPQDLRSFQEKNVFFQQTSVYSTHLEKQDNQGFGNDQSALIIDIKRQI